MSTKLNPGDYDCYANLEPDEPYYVLMGRSRLGAMLTRFEALARRMEISAGIRPNTPEELRQIGEALNCARDMEEYYAAHKLMTELATLEFNSDGYVIAIGGVRVETA